jgi:hypothetical protein
MPRGIFKNPKERNKRISLSMAGEKNHQWKDGERSCNTTKYHQSFHLKKLEIIAGRKKPEKCELCGRGGSICFDHDHKTNKFRGWICRKCNSALGMAEDNIQTLELMIEYIKNNNVRF